jgi:hypothetical protein
VNLSKTWVPAKTTRWSHDWRIFAMQRRNRRQGGRLHSGQIIQTSRVQQVTVLDMTLAWHVPFGGDCVAVDAKKNQRPQRAVAVTKNNQTKQT